MADDPKKPEGVPVPLPSDKDEGDEPTFKDPIKLPKGEIRDLNEIAKRLEAIAKRLSDAVRDFTTSTPDR